MSTIVKTSIDQNEAVRRDVDLTRENGSPIVTRLLSQVLDDHTIGTLSSEVLPRLSLHPGWRGLIIGAGTGHIRDWLADRAAPEGTVTRLDQPAEWRLDSGRLDPRTHIPGYDLILTRMALATDPERDRVLASLVGAVRPGGVLVVVEWGPAFESPLVCTPVRGGVEVFEAVRRGLEQLSAWGDPVWIHRLASPLRDSGFSPLDTIVHSRLWRGGEPGCLLYSAWAYENRHALPRLGIPARQLPTLHQTLCHPLTMIYAQPAYTALGQRPN